MSKFTGTLNATEWQRCDMCGICGFVGLRDRTADALKILRRMSGQLAHRGPDDNGEWFGTDVALATRRLSIIDLSPAGHQPMVSADGRHVVTFNGEIYNHRSLRAELEAQGCRFRSHSDTECLLHLYAAHGDAMLEHLRGMFAFALWDNQRRRLLIARDRLGQKPLHYFAQAGTFAFASEIKSLLEFPAVARALDWQAADHYFNQRFVLGPRTIFRDIQKLQPGHCLIVEDGQAPVVHRYWAPPRPTATAAPDLDELDALLRTSVESQLVSDVPVGAFLSGGLDSSLVVALVAQVHPRPIKTFSIGFDMPGGFDEAPFAKRVSEQFGTQHFAQVFTAADLQREVPRAMDHLDEPLADAATLPTLLLSRAAARELKVVVTGDGADEIFAGYARHRREQIFGAAPMALRPLLTGLSRVPLSRRAQKALRLAGQSAPERSRSYHGVFTQTERTALLSALQPDDLAGALDCSTTTDWLLTEELQTWLPDDFLVKLDRMSMAASLEARSPFLDHVLVERMMAVPARFKVNRRGNKLPLRALARRYLPAEIVARPKHGFEIPLNQWLRGDLKTFAADALLGESAGDLAPAPALVRRYWEQHQRGTHQHGLKLWTLLCWNLWRNRYRPHE